MEAKILNHLTTGAEKTTDLLDLFSSDNEGAEVLNRMRRAGLVRMVGAADRSRWESDDLQRVEDAFQNDNCWMRVELAE